MIPSVTALINRTTSPAGAERVKQPRVSAAQPWDISHKIWGKDRHRRLGRSARNGTYGDAMRSRICHCHHDAVRFYRKADNVAAVIMRVHSVLSPGLRCAYPGLLDSCRPCRADFAIYQCCYGREVLTCIIKIWQNHFSKIWKSSVQMTVKSPFFEKLWDISEKIIFFWFFPLTWS